MERCCLSAARSVPTAVSGIDRAGDRGSALTTTLACCAHYKSVVIAHERSLITYRPNDPFVRPKLALNMRLRVYDRPTCWFVPPFIPTTKPSKRACLPAKVQLQSHFRYTSVLDRSHVELPS